ncbi:hypothetical protein DFH07DRAFT_1065502 [Mycena maculata]|uniref:Uncharacterized protein n=1 Tax=Mycena maculata TaxID=230809 RepID=A0AAD7MVW3_9AGAR|nr:hypothetical protein DFH07DRAFT_1065502 [Mycena maculata]
MSSRVSSSSESSPSGYSLESFAPSHDSLSSDSILITGPVIIRTMTASVPYICDEAPREDPESKRPFYSRRSVVLTETQKLHPPTLPSLTPVRVCKALLRVAKNLVPRSRRTSTPLPLPIDPKSLSIAEIPVTVETSLNAPPLPKGPAPTVSKPARRLLSLDPALCPGW